MTELPILYKYTTTGKIQQWQIICPPNENYYYTVEGIKDGKLTVSDPTYCLGKNIGKSNETSDEQQAQNEALAKWEKKVRSGYNKVLTNEKKFFEPMLAHEFSKYSKLLFTVRTFIQPKLDGVRCYMNGSQLTSRNGTEIVSCPHLNLMFGLDGELYNHDLHDDFNKIISLTRKIKPTQEEIQEAAEKVQFWAYDYPTLSHHVFSKRYNLLTRLIQEDDFGGRIKLVPTYEIKSMEELQEHHAKFISEGYEGSIIRMDLGPYENKRSKQLLKYKDFQDAEFKIVDITPGLGNRGNVAGRLICELPNGKTFGCSMTGTLEFMERVLHDKDKIIGLEATVKFFEYTPDLVPRFPVLKNIIGYV